MVDSRFDCVVFIFASIVNKTCVMLNKMLYYNSFMFFFHVIQPAGEGTMNRVNFD